MLALADGLVAPTAAGGRPVAWAATGRSGGRSRSPYDTLNLADHVGDDAADVAANRAAVVAALGAVAGSLAVMAPVHGAGVAVVDGPGTSGAVDGLVSDRVGLVLLALGADCVPVGLVGADGRTIGVAHCGWRGLAADIVGAMATTLATRGTRIATAVLGPAICGSCYPVPPARAGQVRDQVSERVAQAALVQARDGQPGIDVRRGLQARLQELDVPDILVVSGCTAEDPGLFSYRRDGVTGRQGIALCLHGED